MNDWSGIRGLLNVNSQELGPSAVVYGRSGLRVFPTFGVGPDGKCECGRGDECDRPAKHPRVKWGTEASCDEDVIEQWWSRWPRSNIGIPTGERNGLITLDLDRKVVNGTGRGPLTSVEEIDGVAEFDVWCEERLAVSGKELSEATSTLVTGGGGQQLVFTRPPGGGVRTVTSWLPGVDIRGEGGYFIGPPSLHVSGVTYAWLNGNTPAQLPAPLADALRLARGGHGEAGTGAAVDYDYERAKREGPPAGARDDFFNRYAFELRVQGATYARAREELERCWQLCDSGSGGGYALETALDKVDRVWADDTIQPEGSGPVGDTLRDWAQGAGTTGSGSGGGGQDGRDNDDDGDAPDPYLEDATDLGNAYRFRRILNGRAHFVHPTGWVIARGTHWEPDRTLNVMNLAAEVVQDIYRQAAEAPDDDRQRWLRWGNQSKSEARLKAMISVARSLDGIALTADDMDRDPDVLNCPNGTYDLRTGELRRHDPGDLITRVTNAPLVEGAESALLDEFEQTFLPDEEEREYFWRVMGAALLGGNPWRAFVVVHGETSSGKSTITDAISNTLGKGYVAPVNASVFRGSLDDRPRPDLMRALSTRVTIAEETSHVVELHADQIKRMTGGDKVVARAMRSNEMIETAPDFMPVIITNEMPHIKGADQALKRRLVVMKYRVTIPPDRDDPSWKSRFVNDPGVQQAILWRMTQGAQRALRQGLLERPASLDLAAMEAFDELDDVAEFITTMKESGRLVEYEPHRIVVSQCVGAKDLHLEYVGWVNAHGSLEDRRNRIGLREFNRRLEQLGWQKGVSAGTRWVGKYLESGLPQPPE